MTAFSVAPGSTIAIVPVKELDQAKQRLGQALKPDARRQLVLAMLRDVLETLRQVRGIGSKLDAYYAKDIALRAPTGFTRFHEPCWAEKMPPRYFSGNCLPV